MITKMVFTTNSVFMLPSYHLAVYFQKQTISKSINKWDTTCQLHADNFGTMARS
ncbi:MAG: quinolinate synthase NadA [Butyrivibrio sp.]|nr:quinolinate synthase NadA [Butyrivibrio sp.]